MLRIAAELVQRDAYNHAAHSLFVDAETRSPLSLKEAGADRYARDPRTEVICVGFALDDEPPQTWIPGSSLIPQEFHEASCNSNWTVVAHNAGFELAIVRHILEPRFNFPTIPLTRWRCTQAAALALGLPARLDRLAETLELGFRKDISGQRLMMMMARPRRVHKGEDATQTFYFCDNDRLQRLFAYCEEDVRVTREIFTRLPPLPPGEQALWELSSRINQRGFYVDRAFAEAARKIAEAAAPEIDQEIAELTAGDVTSINQVAKLQAWLQRHGCSIEKVDRKTIEKKLLDPELVLVVRRVLELRLGGAQAAVKKIDALLARAGDDDRIHGAFRYHGAGTGRWAGEGVQPHNLKRPVVDDLNTAVAAVATGDYQHVRSLYPRPLSVVGDCSRAAICAASGRILVGADFSSVESRILAWAANERWKIDIYYQYDATGDANDEPYRITAARIFHVSPDKITKEQRAAGKTCDLSFGYQGGVNAFRKFSEQCTDEEIKEFNREWRTAHPAIRKFWFDVNRAALSAVRERGRIIHVRPVAFKSVGASLLLRLPSGRKITYPFARAVGDAERQHVAFSDNAGGRFVECRGFGGLWTENIVSGIARDLLAAAMLRIEAAGYPIVLHVHDEIVAEVPEGFGSTNEFVHLMTRKPAWALDLPIAAKAWTGKRFTK